MKEQINVLSLFDGISCAQQALKEAQIKVNYYFASEIEQPSINITQSNFPNTIQLGSVLEVNKTSLSGNPIDLLVGGSPSQDLSVAGKRRGLQVKSQSCFTNMFVKEMK
jgi:DNA (cytosine-5)-methyltransferase 3A